MAEDLGKKTFREKLKLLFPLIDNLRRMLAAARHAFNRHSRAELAKIAKLQDDFTLDIDPFFEWVEKELETGPAAGKADLLKFQQVLSNLELMAREISGLAEPIRRKGNHGAILSDKDVVLVNNLFSQQEGFLRVLVDIFTYNDAGLKAYVVNECRKIRDASFRDEADHEFRMMDSPGQPDAWSIHIEILEHFREGLKHLIALVEALD
ncbi:MAG: hypothetical protein QME75_10925 [Deltaproteobacteria bacterium]|nr:hypothetical protein [Deltaproteobacteria bacterium]